jgi:hypothetical protein
MTDTEILDWLEEHWENVSNDLVDGQRQRVYTVNSFETQCSMPTLRAAVETIVRAEELVENMFKEDV